MRKKGSVTVVFSLVFTVMFSFILSFFEMAAYTAREAYHASAALLATENYFAAYLEPLYSQYHIFAREVPEHVEISEWTDAEIAEDVRYMTAKQEGAKSLLLRGGAEFGISSASVLTENTLEGLYTQAVTSMKYRAAPEIAELLKEFSGMTEQADAHLEFAAAKATADQAYAKVDEKILHLIELVDGVDITKYEKYMGGKSISFQKERYVKYFCTNPEGVAQYFDRAEVYRSFLGSFENPQNTLKNLADGAEALVKSMEEREKQEAECRRYLTEIEEALERTEKECGELAQVMNAAAQRHGELTDKKKELVLSGEQGTALSDLKEELRRMEAALKQMSEQAGKLDGTIKELKRQKKELSEEQESLEKWKKEQEKEARSLEKEEEAFLKRCSEVGHICEETRAYVEEISEELERAKKVRETAEDVLELLSSVIGETATAEYRAALQEYLFYENPDGYDFDRICLTLSGNEMCLDQMTKQINGTDILSLSRGISGLRQEQEAIKAYSFSGLKLDYGELPPAENLYDGVEVMLSDKLADGILGFLTDTGVSEKELEVSYLPSGFRQEEDSLDILSLLGTDMGDIFSGLRKLLPEETSAEGIIAGVTDAILFQSYLATHFSNYTETDNTGALSYEWEYLIAGKNADRDNLLSVAMRIVTIRAILHFISLYTDSARRAPAEQAALAVCGFIGLPALKNVAVLLLLFVWALEEAMIDTAALLQGKKLLLYPGKTGGSVSFPEIVLFSKSFVAEKAKKKQSAGASAVGYSGFLHLFLCLTSREDKIYRAADLIQENLRKNYRDTFRMDRCVWSVSYTVDGREYTYAYK